MEELMAQADALANELQSQLSSEPSPPVPQETPKVVPADDDQTTTPPADDDPAPTPPAAVGSAEELDRAIVAEADRLEQASESNDPASQRDPSSVEPSSESPTDPLAETSPPSDAALMDAVPAARKSWIDRPAGWLRIARSSLSATADSVAHAIGTVLDLADRPFRRIPSNAKVIVGYLGFVTLFMAVVTLAAGFIR